MMRIREGLQLMRTGTGRLLLRQTVRERLYSRRVAIGVRRDLNVPHDPGPARIPLEVRQLRPEDDLSFIADDPGLTPREARERAVQRWLLNSDLPPPWVAVEPDGTVCFMVWLLFARDNAAIQKQWGEVLPMLKPDEALLEGPYTAESHRGLRVMHAMVEIFEAPRDFGVRYEMGFIGEKNAAQLRVAQQGLWVPFVKREVSYFLFRRHVRFLPFSEADEVALAKTTKQLKL
jgi:hypothetical protein